MNKGRRLEDYPVETFWEREGVPHCPLADTDQSKISVQHPTSMQARKKFCDLDTEPVRRRKWRENTT